jgi:hypothetical protein
MVWKPSEKKNETGIQVTMERHSREGEGRGEK